MLTARAKTPTRLIAFELERTQQSVRAAGKREGIAHVRRTAGGDVHRARARSHRTNVLHSGVGAEHRIPLARPDRIEQGRGQERLGPFSILFNRLGEMRDRTFENQRYRASGLNLVVAAIILEHSLGTCNPFASAEGPKHFRRAAGSSLTFGVGAHQFDRRLHLARKSMSCERFFPTTKAATGDCRSLV